MVFTANAGLVFDGTVALSSFYHPERQGEEPHFRRWLQESGFAICDVPRRTPFEGEGDALFEADGSRLWAGHGPRTNEKSLRQLTDLWNIEVIPLRLEIRASTISTLAFAALQRRSHVLPAAFDPESQKRIQDRYPKAKRICVSEADALGFACNAINIGRNILLNRISTDLSTELQSLGYQVIEIELTEFLKAGGAAKCLVLRLSEMDVTHRASV